MKFSGPVYRLVKLQRPPPEIKIFLPMRSDRSSTRMRRPRLPASIAHIRPAAPAPRTMASYFGAEEFTIANDCLSEIILYTGIVQVLLKQAAPAGFGR